MWFIPFLEQAIEEAQKEIDKKKAIISIYNELYVQTQMEYYALADTVDVQLDSSSAHQTELSSQQSSGFFSARRRERLEVQKITSSDLQKAAQQKKLVSEEKAKIQAEEEALRRSIEENKARLNRVQEVSRSSLEISQKSAENHPTGSGSAAQTTNDKAASGLRNSKNGPLRTSSENPLMNVQEENSDDGLPVAKPQIARNDTLPASKDNGKGSAS